MKQDKAKRKKIRNIFVAASLLCMVIFFCCYFFFNKETNKFEFYSPDNNLAFNDGTFIFPNPMESDPGWGEAVFPWHMVDGLRDRGDYWAYGLAFTGGKEGYQDDCGWRQATVDFGTIIEFNRIVIWHAGNQTNISEYYLLYWKNNELLWDTLMNKHDMFDRTLSYREKNWTSIPVEDTFPAIKSSKVRYLFYNCHADHGWIKEFEVYNDEAADRPACLLVK